MQHRRTIVSLVASMLFAADSAAGQAVRGTIREGATGQPIAGAVVWLSDSAGALLARSIGDADGRFAVMRLRASARLHVLHIGFRPVELALKRDAADSVIDVQMSALPLTLDAVEASTRRVCPGERGTSQALDLWEQARSALLASVVARESAPPHLRVMSFTRSIEPVSHTLLSQVVRAHDVVGDRSYVAGRSPWAFAEEGYMREERDGSRTFYAPDDNVMLDPTFAGTHCLRVVEGSGPRSQEIGIGFEPVTDHGRDTLVDVTGVLWLDRATAVLHSVEFHYSDLEPVGGTSGGEIFFSTMPNGAPMIDHWLLHFPVLVRDIPLHPSPLAHHRPDRQRRYDMTVHEYREVGGTVAAAAWRNGLTWRSPLVASVKGQLVQLNGQPAAGARVWLHNAPDTTTTDNNGYFTLDNVLPGQYSIKGADSTLARVGFTRVWGQLRVVAGPPLSRPLFFYYSSGEVLELACRGQGMPVSSGIVLGRVVDAKGDPVSSAHIDALWSSPATGGPNAAIKPDRSTDVDEDGRFAICGAPSDQRVRLIATGDTGNAATDVKWNGKFAAIVITVH